MAFRFSAVNRFAKQAAALIPRL